MFPKSLEIANLKLPEAWLETQFRAHEPLNTFSPNFTTCIEITCTGKTWSKHQDDNM